MIRNTSAVRVLQCALCLCLSPLLMAQEMNESLPAFESEPVPTARDTHFMGSFAMVPLRLDEPVRSATALKGDRVRFTMTGNLYDGDRLVIPAGTSFTATVSRVQPKSLRHSGEITLSDAVADPGNGQQIRLTRTDGQEKLGPGAIPAIVLACVTIVPIEIAVLLITLPFMAIQDIREHHGKARTPSAKAEPTEQVFEEGAVFTYYADRGRFIQVAAGAQP